MYQYLFCTSLKGKNGKVEKRMRIVDDSHLAKAVQTYHLLELKRPDLKYNISIYRIDKCLLHDEDAPIRVTDIDDDQLGGV